MTPDQPDERTAEALLRRFEPLLRFTGGERFYPMDAAPYVRACSLWVQRLGEAAVRVVPDGKLDLENIAQQPRDEFGAVHFLKFTDEIGGGGSPAARLKVLRERAEKLRASRTSFRPGSGRLARVGYVSRFADALYSITMLARGRVPGEATAAALDTYRRIMAEDEHYRYHGRAVRQDGWIVLQYWLFYAFNDWRSGFYGANDHESDWEKVFVYLSETESGEVQLEWVAYASHHQTGDDIRRRWDDPELETSGEHPVVYICAGSHASYYSAGEYLTELQLPFPSPLAGLANAAIDFWRKRLSQYAPTSGRPRRRRSPNYFRIPFVDYARGDGLSVGPGGDREWDPPRLMQEPLPPWVSGYRGMWGLYTRDPFEGEDAPAGPMYNRDKSVARAWCDPVGWAGLDKVPPPNEALEVLQSRRADIEKRVGALRSEAEEKSRELRKVGAEAEAVRGRSHLDGTYEASSRRMEELSREIGQLRAQLATDESVSASLAEDAGRLQAGERGDARAHISRTHQPASEEELRTSRVAEVWAALSVGLMLIVVVVVALYAREQLTLALVGSIALFVFFEAGFKGRLARLIGSLNVGLAAVAGLILLYEFFWPLIIATVLVVGLYTLWDNLRELRR